jgi:hypothetical protein
MTRTWLTRGLAVLAGVAVWTAMTAPAAASEPPLPRYSYYPYHYFPHSYWPALSPQ